MKRLLLIALLAAGTALAKDDLEKDFRHPPEAAKAHTWWHWMNGTITKEGITADLEAMKRVGLGGAQIFNVDQSTPAGPAPYLSAQWLDLFRFAAAEADRLGLELCFHNCAGWSSSGGPWVKPEFAMQTVVASETSVKGPARFDAIVTKPRVSRNCYRDIAVLAYPTPARNVRVDGLSYKVLGNDSRYGVQPEARAVPAESVVPRGKIVDLTARLGADGRLAWDVPAGDWTIVRLGYTPTGRVCAPAPIAGRGLEVDKLSREAFDAFWAGGVQPILDKLGPLAGKSLNNCLIDSYEMGCNNWTPKFREEFIRLRGYDPFPMLLALRGTYVDSGEVTERFLWDFRRTIGDLFYKNYYAYFSDKCRKHKLLASIEPYDGPFECLQIGAQADILMGEFWAGPNPSESGSVKLAASAAHTHGIRIVGAESFTADSNNGRWLNHPGSLKALGDLQWCAGINRFILHCYAHQPWNLAPGMTMGPWGTHFGRLNTWWEQSRAWLAYVARGQALLQKGQPAADVLFFGGEAAPNGGVQHQELKAQGYDYDAAGTDLMPLLKVRKGRIVTPAGTSYALLVLPRTPWMTPDLARNVQRLVKDGAVVVGPKPQKSPSLAGYPACDAEVQKIADAVWGSDGSEHSYGRGRVLADGNVLAALQKLGLAPDCATTGGAPVAFIHRRVGDADVYLVANRDRRAREVTCAFRVAGRLPELWDAETGTIAPAPVWKSENGVTSVTLDLEQAGSRFVVFRSRTKASASTVQSVALPSAPPPAAGAFKLMSARYGAAPEGPQSLDITDRLNQAIQRGQTTITADNELAGQDPAVNVRKKLWVEYVFNGATTKLVVEEDAELNLPGGSVSSEHPKLTVGPSGTEVRVTANGSYLVKLANGTEKALAVTGLPDPVAVAGPWSVAFQPGRGAPAKADFEQLINWPDHADTGIKYFSGTATYRRTLDIPAALLAPGREWQLDLGAVQVIAEVRLNGKNLGILWKAPFRVDITAAAKAGCNKLEIEVTNLWPNRLIGDEQLPDDVGWNDSILKGWPEWVVQGAARPVKERVTFTTWHHWRKNSPLQPSGLLGPVVLRPIAVAPVGE